MKREYLNENVYEALQRRLKFLFEEFDNIFVSFSGGKDSGLLLNLVLVLGLPADGDKDGTQQLRNVLVSLGQHQRRCLGQADASARICDQHQK